MRYNAAMNPTGFSDCHCHLDDPAYDGGRLEIIEQCRAQGFARLVTVAEPYSPRSLELSAEMISGHDFVACTVGAHPHQADQYSPEVERRQLHFLTRQKALAIGEIGLDFHYHFSSRENQEAVFRRQVAIARELGLPLVVHSRQAEERLLQILEEERFPAAVVFHCYTGAAEAAAAILRRGYYLSFSGIITFKKADALRAIVASTPLDRLLSETDSPYLAPEPGRGEVNTPLNVVRVVERIAELKNTTPAAINEAVAENLQRLQR